MPANVHFLRKLASDELQDTLFFATGEVPIKEKSPDFWTLTAGQYKVLIFTNRKITVNGEKCKSAPEAKYVIQEQLQ